MCLFLAIISTHYAWTSGQAAAENSDDWIWMSTNTAVTVDSFVSCEYII